MTDDPTCEGRQDKPVNSGAHMIHTNPDWPRHKWNRKWGQWDSEHWPMRISGKSCWWSAPRGRPRRYSVWGDADNVETQGGWRWRFRL